MRSERYDAFLVIWFLGLFALIALLLAGLLLQTGKDASGVAIISGLAGTAVGSLGGLLASTKPTPQQQDVNVVNGQDGKSEPVLVQETPTPELLTTAKATTAKATSESEKETTATGEADA